MPLTFNEYQLLVEQAPIMIWRSDTEKLCDYFNRRWLEFTGRPLEAELGHGWAEGVFPDDYDRCLQIYVSAFDRREIFEMQYRLRRADGVYRWIFDRGVPYHDAAGAFLGYIGSCIDVTEKVEAQDALQRAAQAELHTLRGMLPICSSCKRIRDDGGYWHLVEVYIRQHSKAEFTHGICPECAKRLYDDL
ncbi:MAG: PAS domain S-box protein [Candidatus Wallbacteria bacterium]|nr:PAS domain S-box protein [Candidatus Wallbacteria bacterium]